MTEEEITELADRSGITFVTGHGVTSATFEWLQKFAYLVAARERELCAKLCDEIANDYDGSPAGTGADNCAAAIRAMGGK
jgi:hypothetical protein